MSIYVNSCTFPSTTPVQSATDNWDAVYTVSYKRVNAILAAETPWTRPLPNQTPGNFKWLSSGAQITAQMVDLSFVRGGSGKTVRMCLRLSSAKFQRPGSTVNLTDVQVFLNVTLQFKAEADHSVLTVTDVAPITVVEVSSTPVLSPVDEGFFMTVIKNFLTQPTTLPIFASSYAQVSTTTLTSDIVVPWLKPKRFDYAVADCLDVSQGGILGILVSTEDDTANFSAELKAECFPTNSGVNAAVSISTRLFGEATFEAGLVDALGGDAFVYNAEMQAFTNPNDVNAFYRIIAGTGEIALITEDQLAETTGATYPVDIRAGSVSLSFAADAMTVRMDSADVTLNDGYKQKLSFAIDFQLAADPATGEIDLVPVGNPVVTSNTIAPNNVSLTAVAIDVGFSVLGLIVGEIVNRAFDWAGNKLFNSDGPKIPTDTTRYFYAAERQALLEGQTVEVGLGSFRKLVVRDTDFDDDVPQPVRPVSTQYLNAVTLDPNLIFKEVAENQNETVGQLNPPEPVGRPGDDRQMNPAEPIDVYNDMPVEIYNRIYKYVGANEAQYVAFAKSCTEAGFTQAQDYFPAYGAGQPLLPRILRRGQLGVRNADPLTFEDRTALYQGSIKYVIDATQSGDLDYGLYGGLVNEFPDATLNPRLSKRTGNLSAFGPRRSTRSTVEITAVAGGRPQDIRIGLFADLRAMSRARVLDLDMDPNAQRTQSLGDLVIQEIVRNTKKPPWLRWAGRLFWTVGAVSGFFVGQGINAAQDAAKKDALGGDATDQVAEIVAAANKNGTGLLFSSVSFPVLVDAPGSTSPPAALVTCAGINGGIILGLNL